MRRAREKREREVAERGETSPADAGEESTQQIPPPPPKRWITVTAEEAFDAFKQGECVVVDVRDVRSFRRESVSGSTNMPLVNVDGRPLAYTYETNASGFFRGVHANVSEQGRRGGLTRWQSSGDERVR